jgi:hypothetical protein
MPLKETPSMQPAAMQDVLIVEDSNLHRQLPAKSASNLVLPAFAMPATARKAWP